MGRELASRKIAFLGLRGGNVGASAASWLDAADICSLRPLGLPGRQPLPAEER